MEPLVPGTPIGIPPSEFLPKKVQEEIEKAKQETMKNWLHKANEKFREAKNGQPGYVGNYLKDLVKGALANGAIEADEIFKMKSEIVFRLENILSADEWQKLAKEFPTDQKGLLKLWSDAGLMSIDEMLEAKGTPQNQQNQKEWSLQSNESAGSSKSPEASESWENIQDLREEWAKEGIRLGASPSDDRFREHMSRAGGSTDGISGYIDSTGKDAEYFASLKGGKGGGSKHNPYEGYSAFQPFGSPQEQAQYLRKQDELRKKYIPELTEFVAENLPKVKDDPNYERLNKAFNRAMEHWQDNPDRAYGDLAIMRSQIEHMQKRGKFNQLMKGMREKITKGDIASLYKESIGSPGGRYFQPGEKVRITIPAELLSYSEGKDLTVVYEPFTVIGTEEDSQMDALMDAGIIIERKEAIAGTYPDGRPRVRGLDIHFTKNGRYEVNGKPVFAGVEKQEILRGPILGSYPLSFKGNPPGVINITDVNGKLSTFDVRRTPPNTKVIDSKGRYAVTRQNADNFLVEIAEAGTFSIQGFEAQSGRMMYSRMVSTEQSKKVTSSISINIPLAPALPAFLLQNPATPLPIPKALQQIDSLSREEFLNILAHKPGLFDNVHADEQLIKNIDRVKLAGVPQDLLEKIIQSSTIDTTKGHRKLVQLRAMIARNLAFQNIPVTAESIQKECAHIAETRNILKDIPLFKGRNVLYAVNSEKLAETYSHGDSDRFGKKENRDAVAEQQKNNVGTLTFIRPEQTDESALKAKKAILSAIVSTEPPLTLYFEGHGLPNDLELTANGKVSISDQELAQAFKDRYKKHPTLRIADPKTQDIIILGCCHNAEFARNVKNLMAGEPSGPVFITESEYGMVGKSNFENKFTDDFSETTLGLGHRTSENPSTFGTIFEHEFDDVMDTNPSVYLPHAAQNGKPGWGQVSGYNTKNSGSVA